MVKSKKNKNKSNKKQVKSVPTGSQFGPVATITTAPVSIGNTIRSVPPRITTMRDGSRIVGRDFAFSVGSTVAASTSWQVVGGMPITPCVLISSCLKNFSQMYAKYRFHYLCMHYITSSATSQSGDVMFYYNRDRGNPFPDFTNSSFLPLVLSDAYTVVGPQWMNHSFAVEPTDDWNTTSYGLSDDMNVESCGELFLFSKTSSANSPGYLLIDYDITFKELSMNPRAGMLPVTRGVYTYLTLGRSTAAVTAASTQFFGIVQGVNLDGIASALPTGALAGDIYKMVACVTNSTVSGVNAAWTNCTTSNLMMYSAANFTSNQTLVLDDGTTLYGLYTGTAFYLFTTIDNAVTNTVPLQYGVTATVTWNLCFIVSLVRQVSTGTQAVY